MIVEILTKDVNPNTAFCPIQLTLLFEDQESCICLQKSGYPSTFKVAEHIDSIHSFICLKIRLYSILLLTVEAK